ncbi:MAG: ABC transporter ATP-binding protein [Pseudomonadota bacterium]
MIEAFFRFFERFAKPFERPNPGRPPAGGIAYIRHFASQVRGPFLAMLVLGGLTALVEAALFVFVGVLVDMMNGSGPQTFLSDHATTLIIMALLVAVVRSAIAIGTAVVEEQIVVPDFFTLVRWQSHQAVSRQDVTFFDDEMAGRISSKVWQAGQAAGDVMVSLFQIIWFIMVFALTTLVIVAGLNWVMLAPLVIWFALVAAIANHSVRMIRDRGRATAEAAAVVTGRIVDGYSNIRTIKLHSADAQNDSYIMAAWDDLLRLLRRFTRAIAGMRIAFQTLSSIMLVFIAGLALWLYSREGISAGEVAVVLTLSLRLNLLMGRLLGLLNGLFRNFGTVQNSAELISKPRHILDAPEAPALVAGAGAIAYRDVGFRYPGGGPVLKDLSLTIPSGQKLGLVGQSGVGKTTLMNLLLRFHDVQEGEILINGQSVSAVTQDSLRAAIGVVQQETSLLHRSIKDNIAIGVPDASMAEIEAAARRAQAHEFIIEMQDHKGRTGYQAQVGERGVKLSGGQRQRIALARVFLKDAPILLLDEATSALDSEAEAAIQENLQDLMAGKTVVAIAHRLSTIAHMDRLIVMEDGQIVEDGTHDTLLKSGGVYARLWKRQSGGFLPTQ